MELPEAREVGWRTVSGTEEKLAAESVVTQLSDYALLSKGGKLKNMTCGCNPDKNPTYDKWRCHKASRRCVPRLCKCQLKCVASIDVVNVNLVGTGDDEDSRDDNDAGINSAESVESEPEGTFDEMEDDWEACWSTLCTFRFMAK